MKPYADSMIAHGIQSLVSVKSCLVLLNFAFNYRNLLEDDEVGPVTSEQPNRDAITVLDEEETA